MAHEKNFTTKLPRTTLGTGLARTGTNKSGISLLLLQIRNSSGPETRPRVSDPGMKKVPRAAGCHWRRVCWRWLRRACSRLPWRAPTTKRDLAPDEGEPAPAPSFVLPPLVLPMVLPVFGPIALPVSVFQVPVPF